MENPLVSIIIPCYNQGKYLQEAVNSVLDSTYKNIEIIVINDGSYLDVDFLKSFSALKTRIIHQENQGVINSKNKGILEAKGKYILSLDADDKIHCEFIEKAVKVFENNNNIGMVYCDAEFFGNKTRRWKLEEYKFPNILHKNVIFNSALFKKTDWEKIGGYKAEMELGCEDWELWISFIENGLTPHKIPEVLFYCRKEENLRTYNATKLLTFIKIRKNIIKLHKDLYKKNITKVLSPILFEIFRNSLLCLYKNKGNLLQKFFKKLSQKQLNFIQKIKLDKKINNFDTYGLNKEQRDKKIIVSLTSYPERIYDIHFSIYSLLNQSIKPDKVILWLAEEEFPNREADLTKEILKLKENGLSIKWCSKNLKVYQKYIPAMQEFPNEIIITADDDIYYSFNFIEHLYNAFLEKPDCIHCHKAYKIKFSKNKQILPYEDWDKNIKNSKPSFLNFNLGVGGVLYPPKCLYEDAFDESLFLNLSPSDDDVWAWAMSVLNNTKINVVKKNINNLTIVNAKREKGLTKEKTLYFKNKEGQSFRQLNNILLHYPPLLPKLIKCLEQEND